MMQSSEPIPEKTNLCNEELRRHLADYSIPELLEIMDQTMQDAALTIQTLNEEINLRLMEQAE